MDQPVPLVTPADVERIIRRDFAPEQWATALNILAAYQGPRVQLAALKMAGGDLAHLREWIEHATLDFRDVLAAAEYPLAVARSSQGNTLSDAERKDIYAADWRQYQAWLLAQKDQ